LLLLKTNQYSTNTMGKKTAKDNELKNIVRGFEISKAKLRYILFTN
jgi:hypothetical protein